MLAASVVLYCLVGLALIGMGYKYISAIPPIDYHAAILSGGPVTDETVLILGGLYKVMGGCFAAFGVATLMIALTGVWSDLFWAKLTLLVMTGVTGYFATTVPRRIEAITGHRTPWRIAAGLSALSGVAFLMSLF